MRKVVQADAASAGFSNGVEVFIKLCGFALVLLYTRYLTPAEFGVLALLYVAVRVVDTVVVQGMTSAVARAWTVGDDDASQRLASSTAFWYAAGTSTLVFGVLALLAAPIGQLLFDAGRWTPVVQWFAVAGILRATQNVPRQMLRMQRARRGLGTLELADFVLAAALNVYFVVVAELGLLGIAYAEMIREALFLGVTLLCTRKRLGFAFAPAALRSLLRAGLPKVPRGLSYLTASVSDRFFLVYAASTAHLGLYVFAYRIAELLELGIRPLAQGLPELHRMGREHADHGRKLVGRFMTYFVALTGVVGLGIVVFTQPLLELLTPIDYFPVVEVVPWLVLALCLAAIQRVVLLGVQIHAGPRIMPRVMSIAALANVAFNVWWIPRHGMWGAAVATTLTQAVLVVVAWVLDRRHFGMRLEIGRLARVLATALATYGISLWTTPDNLVGRIAAGLAVVLLYPALLGVVGFYTNDELERLRELVNHRITLRNVDAEKDTVPEALALPDATPAPTPAPTERRPARTKARESRPLQPR